jgi:NAD-dependent dihydropyrimidine dehydrogenase PreA subunit
MQQERYMQQVMQQKRYMQQLMQQLRAHVPKCEMTRDMIRTDLKPTRIIKLFTRAIKRKSMRQRMEMPGDREESCNSCNKPQHRCATNRSLMPTKDKESEGLLQLLQLCASKATRTRMLRWCTRRDSCNKPQHLQHVLCASSATRKLRMLRWCTRRFSFCKNKPATRLRSRCVPCVATLLLTAVVKLLTAVVKLLRSPCVTIVQGMLMMI